MKAENFHTDPIGMAEQLSAFRTEPLLCVWVKGDLKEPKVRIAGHSSREF
jgi:hypothetical protein